MGIGVLREGVEERSRLGGRVIAWCSEVPPASGGEALDALASPAKHTVANAYLHYARRLPMIRDDLAHAVRRALADAGLPEPPGGVKIEPPKQRDHGDWATNAALALAKTVGRRPLEIAEQLADDARRGRACRTWSGPRPRRPGFVNLYLAAHLAARRAAERRRRGRRVRHVGRAGRGAHQPRVRVGQPDRPVARGRRPVGRGRRRDRQPARVAGRGGAPRVLPERHRQPAQHVPRLAVRAVPRRAAARGRLPGPVPRRPRRAAPRRAGRRRRARRRLASGACSGSSTASATTSVASACTSTPGSRNARCTNGARSPTCCACSRSAASCSTTTARAGCGRPTSATRATACSFGPTARRRTSATTSRTTATRSRRGWTHLIDMWGADHHGQVKSLQAGMEALGFGPPPEPEVLLGQLVKLVRDGRGGPALEARGQHRHARRHPRRGRSRRRAHDVPAPGHRLAADVRSRRRDTAVDGEPRVLRAVRARAGLVDRTPRDRSRRSCERRSTASTSRRSPTSARSRCCGCSRSTPTSSPRRPRTRAPQKVTTWVRDFARAFHGFYRDCRVISPDAALTQARLWLAEASRIGLANALGLLGVERADRDDAARRRRRCPK